jgi:hypothetical protein
VPGRQSGLQAAANVAADAGAPGEHQAEADLHREAIGHRDRAHGPLLETPTICVPVRLERRGGRKLIVTPDGASLVRRKPARDDTLIKALIRAHRWRRRIESRQARSITHLAEQEGVTDAYVCRLLPLTCFAPDIVEAILDGRQPKGLRLAEMLPGQSAELLT